MLKQFFAMESTVQFYCRVYRSYYMYCNWLL